MAHLIERPTEVLAQLLVYQIDLPLPNVRVDVFVRLCALQSLVDANSAPVIIVQWINTTFEGRGGRLVHTCPRL